MSDKRIRNREEYERRRGYNRNSREVGEPEIGYDPTRNWDPEPYGDNRSRGTTFDSTNASDTPSSSQSTITDSTATYGESPSALLEYPDSAYTNSSNISSQSYAQFPSAQSPCPVCGQVRDNPLESSRLQSRYAPQGDSAYDQSSDAPSQSYAQFLSSQSRCPACGQIRYNPLESSRIQSRYAPQGGSLYGQASDAAPQYSGRKSQDTLQVRSTQTIDLPTYSYRAFPLGPRGADSIVRQDQPRPPQPPPKYTGR